MTSFFFTSVSDDIRSTKKTRNRVKEETTLRWPLFKTQIHQIFYAKILIKCENLLLNRARLFCTVLLTIVSNPCALLPLFPRPCYELSSPIRSSYKGDGDLRRRKGIESTSSPHLHCPHPLLSFLGPSSLSCLRTMFGQR